MCGRFALNDDPKKFAEHFKLSGDVSFTPSWNIAPSTKICSITADEEHHRHLSLMKWGLIPSWAKDAAIGSKLNNARGETVAEKPSFRTSFKHNRCIIPASGFFEWKTENGVKQPYYISFKSGEPMAFAGLWSKWNDIDSCCIITTSAAFVLGAAWAGMAGNIFATKMTIIAPESFSFWESVLMFAVVILGGAGSIPGVLVGSFLIIGLPELFRGFADARMLIFGAAMILMMIFRNQGIVPGACAGPIRSRGWPRRRVALPGQRPSRWLPRACSLQRRRDEPPEIRSLTKRFGGLVAVKNVSFDVEAGSIVGLIGPNGAGKTTVFNLITGIYRADEGEIQFQGKSIAGLPTHRIVSGGIARTFQTIRLFQNLSVLDNVLAGRHCRMKSGVLGGMLRHPRERREEKAALVAAVQALDFVRLRAEAQNLAKNLSYGNQRLLEIARALATKPQLVILDEPAGGMNEQETASLISLIRKVQDQGITVLLIEHDMSLVMRVCEKIVVLEYGSKIAEGTPQEIKSDKEVVRAYLGAEQED